MADSRGDALGNEAAHRLVRWGGGQCRIEPGLTEVEFARIETDFGFAFAADHRAFLAAGLPVRVPDNDPPGVIRTYDPWPDWRDGDPKQLRDRLDRPMEGLLFDVKHNAYWDESWGERPADVERALEVARQHLSAVPTLVPVFGHRYLPAGREDFGHPVLSVWQRDIIYYGLDLADYITREFGVPDRVDEAWSPRATVEFWRDFL
ncbi:MAG: hypothetical protein HOW97_22305 [Catenulispora sp.]|nr:hypothetical protein [Catenulispora sp.]